MSKIVYLLEHSYNKGECKEIKLLGVYSSLNKIKEAMRFYKEKAGFIDYPDNFNIVSYTVNVNANWKEGFINQEIGVIKCKEEDIRILMVHVKDDIFEITDGYFDHPVYKNKQHVRCEIELIDGCEEFILKEIVK